MPTRNYGESTTFMQEFGIPALPHPGDPQEVLVPQQGLVEDQQGQNGGARRHGQVGEALVPQRMAAPHCLRCTESGIDRVGRSASPPGALARVKLLFDIMSNM